MTVPSRLSCHTKPKVPNQTKPGNQLRTPRRDACNLQVPIRRKTERATKRKRSSPASHHRICHRWRTTMMIIKKRKDGSTLCSMTRIAPTMATNLAPPDGHKRAGVAIRAAPCEDIAVGSLYDGKGVSGALIGHCICLVSVCRTLNKQLTGRI